MESTRQLAEFAAWLREVMESRNYPTDGPRAGGVARLAEDSGVSQPSLSRILNPQSGAPSISTLRQLAPVLGVSLREMLVRSGLATAEELPVVQVGPSEYVVPVTAPPTPPDPVAMRVEASDLAADAKRFILDQYQRDTELARSRALSALSAAQMTDPIQRIRQLTQGLPPAQVQALEAELRGQIQQINDLIDARVEKLRGKPAAGGERGEGSA